MGDDSDTCTEGGRVVKILSGAGLDDWQGKGEFTPPGGLITLRVDYDDEDYHIDAKPGHSPVTMRTVLAQARACGLEPMDSDECEPEILEDGTVRIYLAMTEQAVDALASSQESRRQPIRRGPLTIAVAASVVALFLPSPLHFDHFPHSKDQAERHAPLNQTPVDTSTKGQ
ncbi:hypothetical protein [Streptomyces sp. NPDC048057]|uniref:hypothetical protein n=1 Tax=Streptomyces sp. NPDC048057 TaxID=3155628 RepID=UPI0033E0DDE1